MTDPFQQFDFHRNAFVLIPGSDSSDRTVTVLIKPENKKQKIRLFCQCCAKKSYADCSHAQKLSELFNQYISQSGFENPYENFKSSIFLKFLEPLTRHSTTSANSISYIQNNDNHETHFYDFQKNPLIIWVCTDNSGKRLIDRLTGKRFSLMNKSLGFIQTDQEKLLIAFGHKTLRQTVEDSVWYRFAYHCFRENGSELSIDFEIDTKNGQFILLFNLSDSIARVIIPSRSVPDVLTVIKQHFPDTLQNRIDPHEHELYFSINSDIDNCFIVNPCISITDGNTVTSHIIDSRLVFGSLIYISGLSLLFRLNSAGIKLLATGWSESKKIRSDEFHDFLDKNITSLSIGSDDPVSETAALDLFSEVSANDYRRILKPQIVTSFDRIELCPLSFDNDKFTLTVKYVKEEISVNQTDLLKTKKDKKRFFITDNAIIDCQSTGIKSLIVSSRGTNRNGTLILSKASLMQFRGSSLATSFSGDTSLVKKIRDLIDFKPAGDLEDQSIYKGTLRSYQKIGVQWLLFLYDNKFGGLLCDDMGLGKTHQVLSFIASLKEHRKSSGPILIVCPTSVISHWEQIISQFAPALRTIVFYNLNRLSLLDNEYDILITSYAILRIDNSVLSRIHFDCAVFDEAQALKNRSTSTFGAAAFINADIKLCLSGTPIENSLTDLKSLFALALPGLLSGQDDDSGLLESIDGSDSNIDINNIRRLTNPFILRRLKETVLTELPPKIIDNRKCGLSGDQFADYQAVLDMKGKPLISTLCDQESDIPYMHVFAVLNNLKRICCHPALQNEDPVLSYESLECDKWDLFKELIDESIESGQKVVVFSQYLGMIDIMDDYLKKMSIGHVLLTGASKKRDQIVKQFAGDPLCRVFVGSLKAGGVGIDLISASVVIHYDRWWNAAREDQATDRVHRIGQKRGVQVFKLITEGTIEEKIDNIILNKKALADSALTEDSPDTLKQFNREELVELLSFKQNIH